MVQGASNDTFNPGVLQLATALAQGCSEVVSLLDRYGSARLLNPGQALIEMLGRDRLDPNPERLAELVHPDDIERVREVFRLVARQPGTRLSVQYRGRHREGHWIPLESTAINQLGDPMLRAIVIYTRSVRKAYDITDEPTDSGVSGWVTRSNRYS